MDTGICLMVCKPPRVSTNSLPSKQTRNRQSPVGNRWNASRIAEAPVKHPFDVFGNSAGVMTDHRQNNSPSRCKWRADSPQRPQQRLGPTTQSKVVNSLETKVAKQSRSILSFFAPQTLRNRTVQHANEAIVEFGVKRITSMTTCVEQILSMLVQMQIDKLYIHFVAPYRRPIYSHDSVVTTSGYDTVAP